MRALSDEQLQRSGWMNWTGGIATARGSGPDRRLVGSSQDDADCRIATTDVRVLERQRRRHQVFLGSRSYRRRRRRRDRPPASVPAGSRWPGGRPAPVRRTSGGSRRRPGPRWKGRCARNSRWPPGPAREDRRRRWRAGHGRASPVPSPSDRRWPPTLRAHPQPRPDSASRGRPASHRGASTRSAGPSRPRAPNGDRATASPADGNNGERARLRRRPSTISGQGAATNQPSRPGSPVAAAKRSAVTPAGSTTTVNSSPVSLCKLSHAGGQLRRADGGAPPPCRRLRRRSRDRNARSRRRQPWPRRPARRAPCAWMERKGTAGCYRPRNAGGSTTGTSRPRRPTPRSWCRRQCLARTIRPARGGTRRRRRCRRRRSRRARGRRRWRPETTAGRRRCGGTRCRWRAGRRPRRWCRCRRSRRARGRRRTRPTGHG